MSKKVPVWLTVTLVLLAALLAFQATFVVLKTNYEAKLREVTVKNNDFNAKLSSIASMDRNQYYGEIDEEKLTDYIIKGYVVGTGDRYGEYYNRDEFADLMADSSASMQGIGVNVIYNADYGLIEVINVMPDSPALEAGIQPGDLIVAVDNDQRTLAGSISEIVGDT